MIAWFAVVFGINSTSNAEIIVRGELSHIQTPSDEATRVTFYLVATTSTTGFYHPMATTFPCTTITVVKQEGVVHKELGQVALGLIRCKVHYL